MNTVQLAAQVAQLARLAADLQRQLMATPPVVAAPPPPPKVVPPPVAKRPVARTRRTRAHFYLRVMPGGAENMDTLYRVLGRGGLAEVNRIEVEAVTTGSRTERLNSRQYQALVDNRRQMIKHGMGTTYVGAIEAVPLTGNGDHLRDN